MLTTRDDAILDDSDDEYWLEQRRSRLRATHAGRAELRAGLTRCLREKGWKERLISEEKARVLLHNKGGVRAAAAWPATSRNAAAATDAAKTAAPAASTPTPMRCPPAGGAMRFPHHAAGSPLQFGEGPASAGGHGTPWSEEAELEATPYYADAKPQTPLCADVFVSPPPPPHASAASPAMMMPAGAGGVAAAAACGAAGDAGAWHEAAGAGGWVQPEAEDDGGCRHALELESPRFAYNGSPEESGGAYAECGLQDATLAGVPGSCDTSYSHQRQRERESGFVSAYARGAAVEEVEAEESESAAAAPAVPACRDNASRYDLASFQKLKEEIHMNQSLLSQNASAHVPFP